MAAAGDGVSIVAFPWLVLRAGAALGGARSLWCDYTCCRCCSPRWSPAPPVELTSGVAGWPMVADVLSGAAVAASRVAWGTAATQRAVLAVTGRPGGPPSARQAWLVTRCCPGRRSRASWSIGPHQQRLRGDPQPGLYCRPGHRWLDIVATVGGITTAHRDGIPGCPSSRLPPATRGCLAEAAPHLAAKGLVSGIAEGCASSGACRYCAPRDD